MEVKDRPLTKKERGFIKDIANGESGIQAVKRNYNPSTTNAANAMAVQIKKRPAVIKKLLSIADSLPDKLLIEKHLALLNKKEVVTKNNMTTGEIAVVETDEIDVQAVSKGLDLAYKLKGSFAEEKHSVAAIINVVNFRDRHE